MKLNIKRKITIFLTLGIFFALSPIIVINGGISDKSSEGKDNLKTAPNLSASESVDVEWNITFGGSYDDAGKGVALDSSGNIYVTGSTTYGGGLCSMFLVKYNNSGVQQWNRTWGGWNEDGNAVAVDSAGSVYVAGMMENYTGMTNEDMFLIKYDNSGLQQWNRSWGGTFYDEGFGVAVDSSDNVYVTGVIDNEDPSNHDIFLVKYDSSGELQWSHTFIVSHYDDIGYGLAVDSSDNVYLTGTVYEFGNIVGDMILMKYDSSGLQQWNRTWGGTYLDEGVGVVVDSSDNIYLTGATQSFGAGSYDIFLVKYDSSGDQLWNRIWGGSMIDAGFGVAVDSSDNVYVTGVIDNEDPSNDDIFLVKYDSSGELQWNLIWGGSMYDVGTGVAVDSSDNVYVTGSTLSFGAEGVDMVLMKFVIEEKKDKGTVIPGYNLFILLGILSVIVILISKKLKKS